MSRRFYHRDALRNSGGSPLDAPISDVGGYAARHRRDSGDAVLLKPADADRDSILTGIGLGNFTLGSGEVLGRFHGLTDALSMSAVM